MVEVGCGGNGGGGNGGGRHPAGDTLRAAGSTVLPRCSGSIAWMRLATLRRSRQGAERPGVHGVARVDRWTSALARRLRPGDIAIIDHLDLDRVSAEALVRCRVSAVVNASPSSSGRYPNVGPEIIVNAGIPLVDDVGREVLAAVEEGQRVRLDGDRLYRGDDLIATGREQSVDSVAMAMARAHAGLSVQLEAFAGNTVEYIRRDRELLLDGARGRYLRTDLRGRPVVLVIPGASCAADLSRLRSYVKARHPVLIGVGEGADALLDAGYRPDLVVGEPPELSDAALGCGADVVVHVHRDGGVRDLPRIEDAGVEPVLFAASGSSADVAMLLADDEGASLIVTAGASASLIEYFDNARADMASSFVTRLRVGGKLVDAAAVAQLHRPDLARWPLLLVVLLLLGGLAAAIVRTSPASALFSAVMATWESLWQSLVERLPILS